MLLYLSARLPIQGEMKTSGPSRNSWAGASDKRPIGLARRQSLTDRTGANVIRECCRELPLFIREDRIYFSSAPGIGVLHL
jgi:hypothetical protein